LFESDCPLHPLPVTVDLALMIKVSPPSSPARTRPAPGPEVRPRDVRWVYDRIVPLYPVSALLFHTTAHDRALRLAEIRNGSRILEVATGTGELFRELCSKNPNGLTAGVDFSSRMAARTLKNTVEQFPDARISCTASDARALPFGDGTFHNVFVCFLLELLPADGVVAALKEFRRVLRPGGRLAMVLTGQDRAYFNLIYSQCTRFAPAVWGRQIESTIPALLPGAGLGILHDVRTWQNGFPARVLIAEPSGDPR
jgi:ubiquinone/menaquinone biosynthesis C-methylase UbiE